jgi:hypothetical protein
MNNGDKPQLHVSMLDMFSRCPIQFQRRYGARFGIWHEEEIVPPGIALVQGIAVHKSVERDLTTKMESGVLLPDEAIPDVTKDEFELNWGRGLTLTDEEATDIKKSKGDALDMAVALSGLHHSVLAPAIVPLALEERFVIALSGFPFDIAGTKDIREERAIRDTKTKSASPPADVAKSMQMACYSISEKVERGAFPEKVYVDALVKTKIPKVVTHEAVPSDDWIQPFLRRMERFSEIIEAVRRGSQTLSAAPPDHWVCTKKFCGYATTCPFWSGR